MNTTDTLTAETDTITASLRAAEADFKERHPEAIVTVRHSKFRVSFMKNRSLFTVYTSVKGHWKRTACGVDSSLVSARTKSREAIARALFPQAA